MSFQDPKVFPLKSCTIVEMEKAKRKALFNLSTTSILYSTSSWTVRAPGKYPHKMQNNITQATGRKYSSRSRPLKSGNSSQVCLVNLKQISTNGHQSLNISSIFISRILRSYGYVIDFLSKQMETIFKLSNPWRSFQWISFRFFR